MVAAEDSPVSGVKLEYLPPYSPDLNPIELSFSKIKAILKRHRVENGGRNPVLRACDEVTVRDIQGFYQHAGYL